MLMIIIILLLTLIILSLFSRDRPVVQGMTRWLPATSAEAKALPREGASAPVLLVLLALTLHLHCASTLYNSMACTPLSTRMLAQLAHLT